MRIAPCPCAVLQRGHLVAPEVEAEDEAYTVELLDLHVSD